MIKLFNLARGYISTRSENQIKNEGKNTGLNGKACCPSRLLEGGLRRYREVNPCG